MKATKTLKAIALLFVIALASCSEDDGATCDNLNVCDAGEAEVLVTSCEDEDGNQTYMIGDKTYSTLQEANDAATCTAATSKANILARLKLLSNRVSQKAGL